jgi:hypothetical protein
LVQDPSDSPQAAAGATNATRRSTEAVVYPGSSQVIFVKFIQNYEQAVIISIFLCLDNDKSGDFKGLQTGLPSCETLIS